MTLTIEIPDEAVAKVAETVKTLGTDMNTFAVAALLGAVHREEEGKPDPADLAALAAAGVPLPGFSAHVRIAREARGDFRPISQILREQWVKSDADPSRL